MVVRNPSSHVVFSSLLWFSWAAAAWEPSTGILSGFSVLIWRQKQFFLSCASFKISAGRSCKPVVTLLCSCVELSTGARHWMRIAQCGQDTEEQLLWTTSGRLWYECFEWDDSLAASGLGFLCCSSAGPVAVVLAQLHVSWVSSGLHEAMQQAWLHSPVLSLVALSTPGQAGRALRGVAPCAAHVVASENTWDGCPFTICGNASGVAGAVGCRGTSWCGPPSGTSRELHLE